MQATGKSNLRPLTFLLPFSVDGAPDSVIASPIILSFEHHTFAAFSSSHVCLGSTVCTPCWRRDTEPRDKHTLPCWSSMWIWSAIGFLDAHLPDLLDQYAVVYPEVAFCLRYRSSRPPIIHSTPTRTAIFVHLTIAISFFTYARFCTLVIREITEYLDNACFTVRKQDTK